MELEITPTPSEEERAAVVTALELAGHEDGEHAGGKWWAAGLPDADDEDDLELV